MQQDHTELSDVPSHPWCDDYLIWMDAQEAERLRHYEISDAAIESAEAYFRALEEGPDIHAPPPEPVLSVVLDDDFVQQFVY